MSNGCYTLGESLYSFGHLVQMLLACSFAAYLLAAASQTEIQEPFQSPPLELDEGISELEGQGHTISDR